VRSLSRTWLGLLLVACQPQQAPPPPRPTSTPVAPVVSRPLVTPQPAEQSTPEPLPAPPLQVAPSPRPAAPKKKKKLVAQHSPSLPHPPSIPTHRPAPVVPKRPTATPTQAPADYEVEVTPPAADSAALPADPQDVLQTPRAVEYGYSYTRSLLHLIRDGEMRVSLVGSGWTQLDFAVESLSKRPIRFYVFPGMIFKPATNHNFASFMAGDVREFYLYPGAKDGYRFQCYSLDHQKPLPREGFPIKYAFEPTPDAHYSGSLRVMRALLTEDEGVPDRSDLYLKNRSTIIQFALWKATAGAYNPEPDLATRLGPMDPKQFHEIRDLVFSEVEKLNREARRF
jgi:hypothetical protein